MTAREDASVVVDHLSAWAGGDPDGFHDAIESINERGQELVDELRANDGDARGIMDDLADEVARLQTLLRGALFIAREAIETIVEYPSDFPATSRAEVLADLVSNR